MKYEVIIPKEVIDKINKIGNKTKKISAYKVYNALLRKNKHRNSNAWFEVSSKYLKQVNPFKG